MTLVTGQVIPTIDGVQDVAHKPGEFLKHDKDRPYPEPDVEMGVAGSGSRPPLPEESARIDQISRQIDRLFSEVKGLNKRIDDRLVTDGSLRLDQNRVLVAVDAIQTRVEDLEHWQQMTTKKMETVFELLEEVTRLRNVLERRHDGLTAMVTSQQDAIENIKRLLSAQDTGIVEAHKKTDRLLDLHEAMAGAIDRLAQIVGPDQEPASLEDILADFLTDTVGGPSATAIIPAIMSYANEREEAAKRSSVEQEVKVGTALRHLVEAIQDSLTTSVRLALPLSIRQALEEAQEIVHS